MGSPTLEEPGLTGTVILGRDQPDEPTVAEHGGEPSLHAGDRVGRYQLVERLGAGGMGVVWLARDPRLERTVAVKVLHEQRRRRGGEARERLRREAHALARLSHPNVVAIYDVGVHDRRVFLTMEHVVGRTLEAWATEGPSLLQVLEVFEQAAAGLAAVHEAGFVHRDFKPANVMIDRDGRVLVMDFGLARIHGPESVSEHDATTSSSGWSLDGSVFSTALTGDGMVMGTPAYMAPEQHVGQGADARADQFSFCTALYEVLLGQRPFRGRNLEELARQKHDARLDFGGGRLELPRAVRALLRRGLHPEPSRRHPSMAALREALARLRRPRRRRGGAWVALGTVGLGSLLWVGTGRSDPDACAVGSARMAQVWSDDARAHVRAAFEATGLGYASDAAQRASARLDAYAQAWTEAHAQACRAADPRDDASLDLRMRCLGEARASMAATVQLLVEADATAVQHAVAQVAGLPPLSRCDDADALAAEVAPPVDPAVAAAVEAVQQRLEGAAALERAGHYARARAEAEHALHDALALGYEPVIARARTRLASAELGLGDAAAARRGLTEAALLAAGQGDHRAAADAATRLVYVCAEELRQPDEAMRWARHAEASLDRLPPDPLARARLQSNLGIVHAMRAEYLRSHEAFERAYEAKREILGDEHPEVAGALENVALSLAELGRPSEAEPIHRRTLATMEAVLGPEHPDLALSQMNLGHLLDELGRHDEAAACYDRALAIARAALGSEHPLVARILAALGHVASAQDRLPDAEAYYRRAAEIFEATYGERHPEHGWSLADRALVMSQLGRDDDALALYGRALEILEATLGVDHDSVAYVLMSQSTSLVELSRLDEAERALHRAGEIMDQRLPAEHPARATYHADRGELLRAQGRLEDARRAFLTGLDVATAALGPEHPEVASILLSLGEVEHALGEPEPAVAHLRRAVAVVEAGPVGEAFRAATRFGLAKVLHGDPAARPEAIALARTARDGFSSHGDVFREDVDEITAWLREHAR